MFRASNRPVAPLAVVSTLAFVSLAGAAYADGACGGLDPVLTGARFVLIAAPTAGARIESGSSVSGCSRTFEGTLGWRVEGRDGRVLGSGTTTGGGADGAGPFAVAIAFDVPRAERGSLVLFEPSVTEEGFPAPETRIPVVLAAGAPKLPLFGRFLGQLPCAECRGVRSELALHGDFGSGPRQFVLTETYEGSAGGESRRESRGDWQFTPGGGDWAGSIVVQLFADGQPLRNYVVEGGNLRQIAGNRKKDEPKGDWSLRRQP